MTFIPILFTLNTFLLLASIGGYHYAKSIDPGFGSGSFGAGLVSVASLLAGCLSLHRPLYLHAQWMALPGRLHQCCLWPDRPLVLREHPQLRELRFSHPRCSFPQA